MSELLYLFGAVALSAIGVTWLWFRRRNPQTLEGAISEFSRGLQALAPEPDQSVRTRPPAKRPKSRPDLSNDITS